jgi:hypothetical protein
MNPVCHFPVHRSRWPGTGSVPYHLPSDRIPYGLLKPVPSPFLTLHTLTLKMGAECSSETLGSICKISCQNPENRSVNRHRCETPQNLHKETHVPTAGTNEVAVLEMRGRGDGLFSAELSIRGMQNTRRLENIAIYI